MKLTLGPWVFDSESIAFWKIYNGATFIWMKSRDAPPYKVPGDHSEQLQDARVRIGQLWRRRISERERILH